MESSYMESLFGFTTTVVMVEKEPPPAEPEPFKIPMKISERVMNNCYMEMELSILVIIYSFYMSYASFSSVQVYRWIKLERNYSQYHSEAKLRDCINC